VVACAIPVDPMNYLNGMAQNAFCAPADSSVGFLVDLCTLEPSLIRWLTLRGAQFQRLGDRWLEGFSPLTTSCAMDYDDHTSILGVAFGPGDHGLTGCPYCPNDLANLSALVGAVAGIRPIQEDTKGEACEMTLSLYFDRAGEQYAYDVLHIGGGYILTEIFRAGCSLYELMSGMEEMYDWTPPAGCCSEGPEEPVLPTRMILTQEALKRHIIGAASPLVSS
jgi:hypothetical protein